MRCQVWPEWGKFCSCSPRCNLYSVFFFIIDHFAFSRMAYEWNHTACILSCLTSFIKYNVFDMHSCCGPYQYWLSFSCWLVLHCTNIPHFVHPFSFWLTAVFFVLLCTIMHKAAITILLKVFLWISFRWGKYLGVELLGSSVCLLSFIRNCKTFSKRLYPFTLPPAMCENSGYFTSLVNIRCCQSLMLASLEYYCEVNSCIFDD